MNEPQGLNLDPHPADPLARLQYFDKRLALCWRVMALAVSTAVASCATVDDLSATAPPTKAAIGAYKACAINKGVSLTGNTVDSALALAEAATVMCSTYLPPVETALREENRGRPYVDIYVNAILRDLKRVVSSAAQAAIVEARSRAPG